MRLYGINPFRQKNVYRTFNHKDCREFKLISNVDSINRYLRVGGFTLVELLVSLFITLIIFTLGLTILTGIMQARRDTERRVQATELARQFFTQLEREFTHAYPGPWDEPFSTLNSSSNFPIVDTNPADPEPGEIELGEVLAFSTKAEVAPEGDAYGREIATIRYFVYETDRPYSIKGQIQRPSRRVLIREVNTETIGSIYINPFEGYNVPTERPEELTDKQYLAKYLFATDVRSLCIDFYSWDPKNKTMVEEAELQDAEYLKVQLLIDDPLRPRVLKNETELEKGTKSQQALQRNFARMLPIPEALRR